MLCLWTRCVTITGRWDNHWGLLWKLWEEWKGRSQRQGNQCGSRGDCINGWDRTQHSRKEGGLNLHPIFHRSKCLQIASLGYPEQTSYRQKLKNTEKRHWVLGEQSLKYPWDTQVEFYTNQLEAQAGAQNTHGHSSKAKCGTGGRRGSALETPTSHRNQGIWEKSAKENQGRGVEREQAWEFTTNADGEKPTKSVKRGVTWG